MFPVRFIILLIIIISCSSNNIAKDNFSFIQKEKMKDELSPISMTVDSLEQIISQISFFQESAETKLSEKDTIGAEIYVTRALDYINELSEQNISILSDDSIFQEISTSLLKLQKIVDLDYSTENDEDDLIKNEMIALNEGVETFDNEVIYVENNPIPYTMNKKVENVIKFFTTKGRKTFQRWLERGSKYESMIKRILREENMPEGSLLSCND